MPHSESLEQRLVQLKHRQTLARNAKDDLIGSRLIESLFEPFEISRCDEKLFPDRVDCDLPIVVSAAGATWGPNTRGWTLSAASAGGSSTTENNVQPACVEQKVDRGFAVLKRKWKSPSLLSSSQDGVL
jgi:hypothetical protein